MFMEPVSLYQKDNKGALRIWTIGVEDGDIVMEYGVMGGEAITKYESVDEGLAGRTLEEQILSRVNSRINKKLDRGYVYDLNEAMTRSKTVNTLGYLKPMLAERFDKMRGKINFDGATMQFKYDGHRCLITNDAGELTAYSRNGKVIDSIDHILSAINLPEGVTVDGELYAHGESLQRVSSWVKRKQPDTLRLVYKIYDVISDQPYLKRLSMLKSLDAKQPIELAETNFCLNEDYVQDFYRHARAAGYEGVIIRTNDKGYEDGKRSKSLIKVKANINGEEYIDDEFIVIDILPSKDGWARLVCTTPEGKTFKVSAPGTLAEKAQIYRDRLKFIGRKVRIEYAGLTEESIPFHPVAVEWRETE